MSSFDKDALWGEIAKDYPATGTESPQSTHVTPGSADPQQEEKVASATESVGDTDSSVAMKSPEEAAPESVTEIEEDSSIVAADLSARTTEAEVEPGEIEVEAEGENSEPGIEEVENELEVVTSKEAVAEKLLPFPLDQADNIGAINDPVHGPSLVIEDKGQKVVVPTTTKAARMILMHHASNSGKDLRPRDVKEAMEIIEGRIEMMANEETAFIRIAPYGSGVEIDLCDADNTRVRVLPGIVEVVHSGSHTLFVRAPASLALPLPLENGDVNLLRPLVNVSDNDFILLLAFITFVLCNPKIASTNYIFLVIAGDQGTGKSEVTRIVQRFTDPSDLGIQPFPTQEKTLAIQLQHCHLAAWDNMRGISARMSDQLCTAATGGMTSDRTLYTNKGLTLFYLHGAMVFNGIHSFALQPDLAQRTMTINTLRINEEDRRSSAELQRQLAVHEASIFGGLLNLSAQILKHLPDAKVLYPSRMIEFVQWLAAYELAAGVESGKYQKYFDDGIREAQLDNLLDDPLAASIIEFSERQNNGEWVGTPQQLYQALFCNEAGFTQRSRHIPDNAIALSKRLRALKESLSRQGIHIHFTRGKERRIAIKADNFKSAADDDRF
jgi:hypothetical protein